MMIEVATIFSNTTWTFWDVMLFCFIWIPLVMLWAFCIADIFGRSDISGWTKTAWLLLVLVIPWLARHRLSRIGHVAKRCVMLRYLPGWV
jgi:Phospholipase_D-nuclease N-terminal